MRISTFFLLLIISVWMTACGGDSQAEKTSESPATMEKPVKEIPTNNYSLSEFSSSPEYADAVMSSMDYKNGKFNFGVKNYKLGAQTPDAGAKMCANSGKGQHIHLIVDNEPYAAKYEANFDYEIADGEHYVLAFLSRSYHESIKNGTAHKATKVKVANKSIASSEDVKDPMLYYSRPKGTYVGDDTKKLMLDFFLVNVDLGADYKVKVEVNGEKEFMVDAWKPYFLEGLPMGDNKVKLTLVDKDGKTVDTPLNPVERVFTLQEDPAPAQ